MPRVVTQRDRRAIGSADAALRAQDQKLSARQLRRVPTHADIHGQPENIAARGLAQQLRRQRQAARGTGGAGLDIEQGGIAIEQWVHGLTENVFMRTKRHFGDYSEAERHVRRKYSSNQLHTLAKIA